MSAIEDLMVDAIHKKFKALPTKSKPRRLANGENEWVPLSGIAILRGTDILQYSKSGIGC